MDYRLIIALLVIWSIILIRHTILVRKKSQENRDKERKILNKHKELEIKSEQSLIDIENRQNESDVITKRKHDSFLKIQESKRTEFERLLDEARTLKNEFEDGFLKGRRWLSDAYSEYIQAKDNELKSFLIVKPNPAWKSAELVAIIKQSRAEMSKRLKFLEYQVKSYEEYFPEIKDYKSAILDELVDFRSERIEDDETIDPALKFGFISKEEYQNLSNTQKFQIALDRYWEKNKSNLEIGRLYERYIGYIFEKDGWKVKYEGIIKGFEDFGRDLICTKGEKSLIIQCKCWSKDKVIREKYIMQLFGTTVLFEYENNIKNITPIFYSTTSLSKEADLVANRLSVQVCYENLKRYPMIKCNINHSTKEKIYHLPFDQQYDKIIIGDHVEEFYADTILEAEEKGFRRAYKWQGD